MKMKAAFEKRRTALYERVSKMKYVKTLNPEGAFYLFVKSPIDDDVEFCALAKKYHILVVPGKSFACPGYVRIAYCVAYDTIINSLPHFKALLEEIRG